MDKLIPVKATDFPFTVILTYQSDSGPSETEAHFFESHSKALFFAADKLRGKHPGYSLCVYVGRAMWQGQSNQR